MIEFRCPHCGKGMQAEPALAGRPGTCPACGRVVTVPKPPPTPGIRIEEMPVPPATKESGPPPPEAELRKAKRFPLAEASCRLWKAGTLSTDKTEYPVEDVSRTGLRAVYGAQKKAGTLSTAPRIPPWELGTRLEVALSVGAFAKPMRFIAELVRMTPRPGGKGYELGLKIVEASEDVRTRLAMLEDRDDLRARRKTGMFGAAT